MCVEISDVLPQVDTLCAKRRYTFTRNFRYEILKRYFLQSFEFSVPNGRRIMNDNFCNFRRSFTLSFHICFLPVRNIHSFIHQYSALEVGLAGNRAQSCDRYGSDTLHPGQVLGGSLPLLSPAFRRSHFRRQVPVSPQRRERFQLRKVELWARNCPVILPKFRLPLNLGIFYMPQIYDMGPTALLPLRRKAC